MGLPITLIISKHRYYSACRQHSAMAFLFPAIVEVSDHAREQQVQSILLKHPTAEQVPITIVL